MKASVYVTYARAFGLGMCALCLVSYNIAVAGIVGANIWLSDWSNDPPGVNGTQDTALRDFRLGVYGSFGLVQSEYYHSRFRAHWIII